MDFNAKVKESYPHLSDNDIDRIVNHAKMLYYSLRYPFIHDITEEDYPIEGFKNEQWVLCACDELIERLGFTSATAYKENNVGWTFDNAQISRMLMLLITPVAGVL